MPIFSNALMAMSALTLAELGPVAGAASAEDLPAAGGGASAQAGRGPVPNARAVRIGIDGEHGMEACHVAGRITAQDVVTVHAAPNPRAAAVDQVEPGLNMVLCEEVTGWRGVVYQRDGDQARECGTDANLAGPRPYRGPCRSGWVPAQNFEVTAG